MRIILITVAVLGLIQSVVGLPAAPQAPRLASALQSIADIRNRILSSYSLKSLGISYTPLISYPPSSFSSVVEVKTMSPDDKYRILQNQFGVGHRHLQKVADHEFPALSQPPSPSIAASSHAPAVTNTAKPFQVEADNYWIDDEIAEDEWKGYAWEP
ncbi:uncharacterized protein BYT42DRAFT_616704 [Radiomyces spectabilis]|uniref:uncharacterized protein n=1 Tax=Radiomyces spectabilis TaxID=64574 RepID=UPI00221FD9EB|nr:uncharacterized protein BYT42DRAFT_616704 [Radiomyces spectabilis]KAI8371627.1 hypothetical protein BYT42DRAFT_616704 [Radiomyces spectabilis]